MVLQTVELPSGVCVHAVKAFTGRQGWYMASSDGSVQCMVMDGDITLSEKLATMSTTGKFAKEIYQMIGWQNFSCLMVIFWRF